MVNVVVLFSALEINLNLNLNSLGSNKYSATCFGIVWSTGDIHRYFLFHLLSIIVNIILLMIRQV